MEEFSILVQIYFAAVSNTRYFFESRRMADMFNGVLHIPEPG